MENKARIWFEQKLFDFDRQCHSQDAPNIEDYLREISLAEWPNLRTQQVRVEFLAELVKIELEHRWKKGKPVRAEDYLATFPELGDVSLMQEIVLSEFDARMIANALPDAAELELRFGDQAPEWQEKLDRLRLIISNESRGSKPTDTIAISSMGSTERTERRVGGMDIQAGDRIGDYMLEKELGRGAFAVVWRATDTRLQRLVAIKILRPDHLDEDETLTNRMMREAQAVAQIDNPGIVHVYEVGQTEGLTYIVQQFINGPTLKELMAKEKLDRRQAVKIIQSVANSLHAAHCLGIVHRDVKPANIMLSEGTDPKVVDFGLAIFDRFGEATLTREGDLLGTPAFMSPQQAAGDHQLVDSRSDVYSLGAVLFVLLTSKLPFEGSTWKVVDHVVHRAPPRPRKLNPKIEKDLETIVLKCLEKQPEHRYGSAKLLAEDLEHFLNGEPILARPVGRIENAWKWARRTPKLASALGIVALMTAGLAGSLVQLNNVSAQRNRAETAESQVQDLYFQSTIAAGKLAMQRGLMKQAAQHYSDALRTGKRLEPSTRLDYVACLIATRSLDDAKKYFEQLSGTDLTDLARGRAKITEGVLALEFGEPFDSSIRIFENALELELAASDRAFVQAMLAETTTDAVEKLSEAVGLEPYHHESRRMLIMLLVSLAEFEDASEQLAIANQLFPNDIDFTLLQALVLAAVENMGESRKRVNALPIADNEKLDWLDLCDDVQQIRVEYSHHFSEDTRDFDQVGLGLVAQKFIDDISPSFQARGFVFPPRVGAKMLGLFNALKKFSDSGQELQTLKSEIQRTCLVHPEGSLLSLAASQYMGRNEYKKALELYEISRGRNGFVQDTRQLYWEAKFALTRVLYISGPEEEKETRLKELVNIANDLEQFPDYVELFAKKKSISLALITILVEALQQQKCSDDLVLLWLDRGVETGTVNEYDSLWIRSIVAFHSGRHVAAINFANELLNLDPEGEFSNQQGAKALVDSAHEELGKVMRPTAENGPEEPIDENP